jgi:hypothetical protein
VAKPEKKSRLGQPPLWRWLLAYDCAFPLDRRDRVRSFFDFLYDVAEAIDPVVKRPVVTSDLAVDTAGWKVWSAGVRVLRTVARATGRWHRDTGPGWPGVPPEKADWLFRLLISRCRPGPVTLKKSGRVVMRNSFSIRTAKLAPASAQEWEAFGVAEGEVTEGARSVRDWWVLVLATLAVPDAPVCEQCEAILPLTRGGRRSQKPVCRSCEQKKYFVRRKARDLEGLKKLWRSNKRAQRGVSDPSTHGERRRGGANG